jgi:hypothetical protein
MRAELYRSDAPETNVAVAHWDGRTATVESSADDEIEGLDRLFRPTPVVIDDASLRQLGQRGESLLQPGDLEWFRAALLTRAPRLGLSVRFVPEVEPGAGWDPAAAYRTFEDQIDRLSAGGRTEPDLRI